MIEIYRALIDLLKKIIMEALLFIRNSLNRDG